MRAIVSNRARAATYELIVGTASVGYAGDAQLTGVRTAVVYRNLNPLEVVVNLSKRGCLKGRLRDCWAGRAVLDANQEFERHTVIR
jgi:hypothetical protein